jgi:hypothetical protein
MTARDARPAAQSSKTPRSAAKKSAQSKAMRRSGAIQAQPRAASRKVSAIAQERLDEALDFTFPASDPISAGTLERLAREEAGAEPIAPPVAKKAPSAKAKARSPA